MFLPSQKNLFFHAIKEQGLNLRDFNLTATDELKLTHKPTGFYFRVLVQQRAVTVNGIPQPRLATFDTPRRYGVVVDAQNENSRPFIEEWSEVAPILLGWLNWIRQELEQPDLWAEMEHIPHLFADEEPATDDHFTLAEVKLLEERVAEVEERILELNLPPEAEAAVVETVRAVPAKATRFTKKELADCIVGSLVKEGFKWGLTTEHMSAAWHACQHFFTLLLPG
jgi:hypothetical protein